jgi:hypothetical protein
VYCLFYFLDSVRNVAFLEEGEGPHTVCTKEVLVSLLAGFANLYRLSREAVDVVEESERHIGVRVVQVNFDALLEAFFRVRYVLLLEFGQAHVVLQLSVLGVQLFGFTVEGHRLLVVLLLEVGYSQVKKTLETALTRPLQVLRAQLA